MKLKGMNEHAIRYRREGLPLGLTIAEWEAREGLPLFSVWPEAEHARGFLDPGRFLYANASDEERAEMMQSRSRKAHVVGLGPWVRARAAA